MSLAGFVRASRSDTWVAQGVVARREGGTTRMGRLRRRCLARVLQQLRQMTQ